MSNSNHKKNYKLKANNITKKQQRYYINNTPKKSFYHQKLTEELSNIAKLLKKIAIETDQHFELSMPCNHLSLKSLTLINNLEDKEFKKFIKATYRILNYGRRFIKNNRLQNLKMHLLSLKQTWDEYISQQKS